MSNLSYRYSEHARHEMARRNISESVLQAILRSPQQIVDAHGDRKIYQSKILFNDKLYLVRVIVEESVPKTVVTVYRTSKIDKYWRSEDESNV